VLAGDKPGHAYRMIRGRCSALLVTTAPPRCECDKTSSVPAVANGRPMIARAAPSVSMHAA